MTAKPWMKFYPRDWRGDQALRMVSLAARGLWMECLAIMHEAKPYGYLVVNGRPVGDDALARMVGASSDEVRRLFSELREFGVCDVTGEGVMFSRRMVRDQERATRARRNGAKGGNPTLRKQTGKVTGVNPADNPPDKPQRPEARGQKGDARARDPGPQTLRKQFEAAWGAYPEGQGRGCGEPEALRAFHSQLRGGADPDMLASACRAYAKATEPGYAQRFDRFMRNEVWREHVPKAAAKPLSVDDQWRHRLRMYRLREDWQSVWGPEPGEPGCKAPAEIQREAGYEPRLQAAGAGG